MWFSENFWHDGSHVLVDHLCSFENQSLLDKIICMDNSTKLSLIATDNDNDRLCILCVFISRLVDFRRFFNVFHDAFWFLEVGLEIGLIIGDFREEITVQH